MMPSQVKFLLRWYIISAENLSGKIADCHFMKIYYSFYYYIFYLQTLIWLNEVFVTAISRLINVSLRLGMEFLKQTDSLANLSNCAFPAMICTTLKKYFAGYHVIMEKRVSLWFSLISFQSYLCRGIRKGEFMGSEQNKKRVPKKYEIIVNVSDHHFSKQSLVYHPNFSEIFIFFFESEKVFEVLLIILILSLK